MSEEELAEAYARWDALEPLQRGSFDEICDAIAKRVEAENIGFAPLPNRIAGMLAWEAYMAWQKAEMSRWDPSPKP